MLTLTNLELESTYFNLSPSLDIYLIKIVPVTEKSFEALKFKFKHFSCHCSLAHMVAGSPENKNLPIVKLQRI